MIYKLGSQGVIKLTDTVLSVFNDYRQFEERDSEAGGTLLGRFILNSSDIVVDKITVPMERDIRKKYYFKRNREDHQIVVSSIWEESGGTCNYMGEWHTHPEPDPVPSSHDLKEWKKVLKNAVYDSDELFFIIVGTQSIGVWVGTKKDANLIKLRRC